MRHRLLIGSLLVVACGPPEVPTRPPLDACAAVTKGDVQRVVGAPIGEHSWVEIPNGTMCSYQTTDAALRGVTIEMYPHGIGLRDMYVEEAGKVWKVEPVALAAIGDEATWLGTQLIAVQGDDLVVLSVSGALDPRRAREEATTLVRTAFERLR